MANDIKKLAQLAKKRLNGTLKESETTKVSTYIVCNDLCKHNYQIRVVASNDDILYSKVCEVLESNFDSPYVLRELVDKDIYDNLKENDKMRYMLNIIEQYGKLKERYIVEHRTA